MKRFIEGEDREQGVLLPEYLSYYVSDENPVRIIDVFVDELGLRPWGFRALFPRRGDVRLIIRAYARSTFMATSTNRFEPAA